LPSVWGHMSCSSSSRPPIHVGQLTVTAATSCRRLHSAWLAACKVEVGGEREHVSATVDEFGPWINAEAQERTDCWLAISDVNAHITWINLLSSFLIRTSHEFSLSNVNRAGKVAPSSCNLVNTNIYNVFSSRHKTQFLKFGLGWFVSTLKLYYYFLTSNDWCGQAGLPARGYGKFRPGNTIIEMFLLFYRY
jgi:hypothetical protein